MADKTKVVYRLDETRVRHLFMKPAYEIATGARLLVMRILSSWLRTAFEEAAVLSPISSSGDVSALGYFLRLEAEHPDKLPARFPSQGGWLVRETP